ncbi:cytochrome b5-like heme/steroid binding domain-containing protein [Aspergillus saccharolyticus JOP 1030-1]|uniref:Cytochrome b5 heme-binding domain-containing protein n=1 Tax=Aspergillus saccharolyticus JOP 1030-1 TaxID=1450539 RepID=A0A319ABQ2_9EURO|nr:hypothetical protein BP01DRAFT_353413 [Aspergillus saccharolyticus JOP 1030-1]PYH49088.1 hypothetical protein BP01DRAFT_353413 [Aspergillus saccharolyticus JOP 1030-1]
MGWVGVATLIAAACYLIYRHPPATWAPQPQPPPEKASAGPPSVESIKDAAERLQSDLPTEDSQSNQSTPKASASTVPSLEIPSLRLEDEPEAKVVPRDEQTRNHGPMNPLSPLSTGATPTAEPNPKPSQSNGSLMPPPPRPVPQILPPSSSSSPSWTASAASSAKTTSMPPPPLPRLRPTVTQQPQQSPSSVTAGRYPPRPNAGAGAAGALRPPPSAASSLRAPPTSSSSSSLAPTKLLAKPPSSSSKKQHILQPGYSPLDWAALTANPNNNLRGANLPPTLIRVTPSMLKAQNGRKGADAWTSYQGKVYNITPYLPFHPGGKGELLRGVGKDSGKLFMEIHPWVNWDAILGECLVGILVAETESGGDDSNVLDAMD